MVELLHAESGCLLIQQGYFLSETIISNASFSRVVSIATIWA